MRLFNKKSDLLLLLRGLSVILTAAIALEATSLIQYYFSKKGIEEEATLRAQAELDNTSLKITGVMDQVETAIRNNLWSVRQELGNADSLYKITRRIVEDNPVIVGSAVALLPEHRTARGKLFSPYSYLEGDEILSKQLGTDEYNYLKMEWFYEPLNSHQGHWSEPYYDVGGGEMLMTTYSYPVQDKKGNYVGVLTADLSLDWLTELVGDVHVYPDARAMLISKRGMMMVFPDETLVMQTTLQDAANLTGDPAAQDVSQEMLAGHTGMRNVTYSGIPRHVFYGPIPRTGWSMAVIIPTEAIFKEVKRVNLMVGILQLLALLTLGFIIYRTAVNLLKFQRVADSKERIENELKIASGIQMAMLPKTFPTYPERSDLDLYGSVTPAKEVGGDLFDFFIRDNRLFFCIGDVSGKGIPASLVMAVTKSLFRSICVHESNPGRIVSHINDAVCQGNETSMFVTFFAGILDLNDGHLRYCNAGHNAPLLLTEGDSRPIDVQPNIPLGIMEALKFTTQECLIPKGSSLFLFTDGLSEAENARHELFGDLRVEEATRNIAPLSAREQIESVYESVREHVQDAAQSDDLTMLCIKYMGYPGDARDRKLKLQNDIRQIPQLADFIEDIADETGINQATAMSLNLALEEAVANAILYSYPEGTEGFVEVEAILRDKAIYFVVSDTGHPFDPTQIEEVDDVNRILEDRTDNALGITLVRNIMDDVYYERIEGHNLLHMTKKLS